MMEIVSTTEHLSGGDINLEYTSKFRRETFKVPKDFPYRYFDYLCVTTHILYGLYPGKK